MADMFSYVGETLRRLRKERGKTLEELGEEAGLGRGQLSRIENSRQEATLSTLAKILSSQNVSRREFFRRYELVETEARAAGRAGSPAGESVPAPSGLPWPEEIREVLGKVESFVSMTFRQPRPVAQGAVEIGDFVVLFRVVSKDAPEAREESPEPLVPAPPAPAEPAPPARKHRGRKR
jgi:transcriptional regulator with XRE-family HTH domain